MSRDKTQDAIENIESLIDEVSKDYFIPKRFRKEPFTKDIKDKYVEYLREEVEGIRRRSDTRVVIVPRAVGDLYNSHYGRATTADMYAEGLANGTIKITAVLQ